MDDRILVQPHPASHREPLMFETQVDVDVIGQVVGVAMPLDARLGRVTHSGTTVLS
jgi:hypothetical protein